MFCSSQFSHFTILQCCIQLLFSISISSGIFSLCVWRESGGGDQKIRAHKKMQRFNHSPLVAWSETGKCIIRIIIHTTQERKIIKRHCFVWRAAFSLLLQISLSICGELLCFLLLPLRWEFFLWSCFCAALCLCCLFYPLNRMQWPIFQSPLRFISFYESLDVFLGNSMNC